MQGQNAPFAIRILDDRSGPTCLHREETGIGQHIVLIARAAHDTDRFVGVELGEGISLQFHIELLEVTTLAKPELKVWFDVSAREHDFLGDCRYAQVFVKILCQVTIFLGVDCRFDATQ